MLFKSTAVLWRSRPSCSRLLVVSWYRTLSPVLRGLMRSGQVRRSVAALVEKAALSPTLPLSRWT